ncbi:MAG: DUF1697 domain-containing protein [Bacteroidia bacterium]|jgi:uncharacterized protein (DUF1697 family)|nr:DUF1697 domain-containing protein [Bacteroidia bacterium]
MSTYIALLRGINVSGKRLIKMDALKTLCHTLGFADTQTYIQSGNLVFRATEKKTSALETRLGEAIEKEFGFEVPVVIKSFPEFQRIVNNNPFIHKKQINPEHLHITFLASEAEASLLQTIDPEKFLPDEFAVINDTVYLHCPNGYGNTKLHNTFFENKLKQTATTRNLKTCNVLCEMATKKT